MKRMIIASAALAVGLWAAPASAAEKLIISSWGGSWKDLIEQTIAKKFKAETGADVEFVTGGTIDRLNKAKLSKDNPESDITFTTSHVGWLYATDGLYETLDLDKIPNAKNLVPQAKISPYHIGSWAYVYTIGYRPDMVPAGMKFEVLGRSLEPGAERQDLVAGLRRQPSRRGRGQARRRQTRRPGKRAKPSSRRSSRTSRLIMPMMRLRSSSCRTAKRPCR